MSDTTDSAPATAAESANPQGTEPAPEVTEPDAQADEDSTEDTGNAEAARYRKRLRQAEAERDQLAEQLTALRTAEAERLAGAHIAKGSALWAGGVTVSDLLNADGRVDPELVKAAAISARDTLGLTKPRPGYAPREGGNPTVAGKSGLDAMVNVVMGR